MSARKRLVLGLAIAAAIGGWLLSNNRSADDAARTSSVKPAFADQGGGKPADQSASLRLTRGPQHDEYAVSRDLYALTLELMPRSETGDGRASRLIASAYQECWLYARSPAGFMNDMALRGQLRPDLKAGMDRLSRRVSQRCNGFSGRSIGPSVANRMLERAAKQGDLAAEVQLLNARMQSLDATEASNSLKALAELAVASRDPDAYLAIAPLMGQRSDGRQEFLYPLPVGSSLAEASWHLAACRLGADCTANGPTVTRMCMFGGVNCGLKNLDQFYREEVLPPTDQKRLWQQLDILAKDRPEISRKASVD
jgi:hypothetical protein